MQDEPDRRFGYEVLLEMSAASEHYLPVQSLRTA